MEYKLLKARSIAPCGAFSPPPGSAHVGVRRSAGTTHGMRPLVRLEPSYRARCQNHLNRKLFSRSCQLFCTVRCIPEIVEAFPIQIILVTPLDVKVGTGRSFVHERIPLSRIDSNALQLAVYRRR